MICIVIDKISKHEYNHNCKFIFFFDKYGNAYLDGRETSYGKILKLGISKTNGLEIEEDFTIIDDEDYDYKRLTSITKINSLTAKLKEDEKKLQKDKIREFYDEDIDDNYYPEDDHYYVEQSDDEDEDYLAIDDYQEFSFCSNDKIKLVNIENEEINALYETIVYDNGNVLCKSTLNNSSIPFRIMIHTNGKIIVKTTGTSEKSFRLCLNEDNNINISQL